MNVRRSSDPDLSVADQQLLKKLEDWGWYVIKVGGSDSAPPFAYSLGLYAQFRHPELIIFGLDFQIMHRLINDAGDRIRQGERFQEGHSYASLIRDYDCQFRLVDPSRYTGLLNFTIWYYRGLNFPVLQLVWPDRTGKFPWQPDFDPKLKGDQLDLSKPIISRNSLSH